MSLPTDLTVPEIRQITSDLRKAIQQARSEGDVSYSTFIAMWCIVDNWDMRISEIRDKEWRLQNDRT